MSTSTTIEDQFREFGQRMAAEGYHHISIEYSGHGDEGAAENITVYDHSNNPFTISKIDSKNNDLSLIHETPDFLMNLLDQTYRGWGNNEGGRGEIFWLFETNIIKIEHREYVLETKFSEKSIDLNKNKNG